MSGGAALNALLALQMGAGLVNVLFGFGLGVSNSHRRKLFAALFLTIMVATVAHVSDVYFDPKFLTFFLGAVITYFLQELVFCGRGGASAWYGAVLSFATTGGLVLSAKSSPAIQSFVVFWVSIALTIVVCLHFIFINERQDSVKVEFPSPRQFLALFGVASAFALTNGLYLIAAHSLPSLLTLLVLDKVCGSSCIALNSHYMNNGFLDGSPSVNAWAVIFSSAIFSLAVCIAFLLACETLGISRLLVAIPKLSVDYLFISIIISFAWGLNALSSRFLRSMQLRFRKNVLGLEVNNLYLFYGLIIIFIAATYILNVTSWAQQNLQLGVVFLVMFYWVAAVLILRGRG